MWRMLINSQVFLTERVLSIFIANFSCLEQGEGLELSSLTLRASTY